MRCLVTFTLLSLGCLGTVTIATQPPNIIFILADDLGWDDVSFHGSKQIPTPNIDTLAYDGIILNNYYVQPICTPSRSALMTGRHPIHTGMQVGVIAMSEAYGQGLDEKLMPEYLKQLGYATHIVGKWHLGYFAEDYTPIKRGFDTHYGYYQGCGDYWDHSYTNGGLTRDVWGLDFWENGKVLKTAFGQYSTELFTQKAEEIIHNHDTSKPLFMYLSHQAVHSADPLHPLEAPWKYLKNFDHISSDGRRKFAGMLSALDDSVGNVTKALKAQGMLNNTIIAFSTDNGGPAAGFDMNQACNFPLRGVKAHLWEGGMRGPGFIWSPLLEKSSYVSNHMMQIFDWLPTFLNVAGYDMTKLPENIDGMDFWHTLSTNQEHSPRTEMLHNINKKADVYSLRVSDMKVIAGKQGMDGWYPLPGMSEDSENTDTLEKLDVPLNDFHSEEAPDWMFETDLPDVLASIGRTVRDPSPVVVKCGTQPANASTNCDPQKAPCLYNITADPCEYFNLAPSQPSVVSELIDRMLLYNKTAVPPRNKPVDPKGYPLYHNGVWAPWIKLDKEHSIEL